MTRAFLHVAAVAFALIALPVACGEEPLVASGSAGGGGTGDDQTGSGGTTSSNTTLAPTSMSSGGSTAGSTAGSTVTTDASGPTSAATESDGSETTGVTPGFILAPDHGASVIECSVWHQDCPPGEKCTPWGESGGYEWNGAKCTPVVPDPDGAGEPCTVQGSATSGRDSCDVAAICFHVDPETLEGECVPLCTGSPNTAQCTDPSRQCSQSSSGVLALCLRSCDPLQQDCAGAMACYPIDDGFICGPDASGEQGADGDPCEAINVCDPGNACVNASILAGCAGAGGCCTPFCDVSNPMCSNVEHSCIPYFEPGNAPPGHQDVGFCALPS